MLEKGGYMTDSWLCMAAGVMFLSCVDAENKSGQRECEDTVLVCNERMEKKELHDSTVWEESGNSVYPDGYGGKYWDSRSGRFVVLMVEGTDTAGLDFVPKGARIKPCKYAYNELRMVMDRLVDYKSGGNRGIYENYPVAYIDEKQNRVVVQLVDCSDKAIKDFKKNVSDSEAIVFEQGFYPEEYTEVPSIHPDSNSWEIEYIPSE